VPIEEKVNFFGDENSKDIIVSWGSPKGPIIEALELLNNKGENLGFMQLLMLHPLPRDYVMEKLKNARRIIDVENNYLGQLGGIIKEETGIQVGFYVLKYTGRPITTTEMYNAFKKILSDQAPERQVLTYGS
jgi:2-oxoglutarate ferredoxin oxidoreductase subunit alpha